MRINKRQKPGIYSGLQDLFKKKGNKSPVKSQFSFPFHIIFNIQNLENRKRSQILVMLLKIMKSAGWRLVFSLSFLSSGAPRKKEKTKETSNRKRKKKPLLDPRPRILFEFSFTSAGSAFLLFLFLNLGRHSFHFLL